jgi:hypothetical protein
LFNDRVEIVSRPLQFFDLVESLLPHIATAALHHLPVFEHVIMSDGRNHGSRNDFVQHRF